MTREVYTDRQFIEFSRTQVFVRVFEDTDPQGDRLARKYRIPGVPILIILDSSGDEVDRLLGFRPAPVLIKQIKEIIGGSSGGTSGRIRL